MGRYGSDADSQDEFRISMAHFIREHFAGVLGDDVHFLDQPEGLEALCKKYLHMRQWMHEDAA